MSAREFRVAIWVAVITGAATVLAPVAGELTKAALARQVEQASPSRILPANPR